LLRRLIDWTGLLLQRLIDWTGLLLQRLIDWTGLLLQRLIALDWFDCCNGWSYWTGFIPAAARRIGLE